MTACPCSTCAPLRALERRAGRWKRVAEVWKLRAHAALTGTIAVVPFDAAGEFRQALDERRELRAENERLRAALEGLEGGDHG